jgi:hypothetical protein
VVVGAAIVLLYMYNRHNMELGNLFRFKHSEGFPPGV